MTLQIAEERFERRLAQVDAKIDRVAAELNAKIDRVAAELNTKIAESKAEIIKWMFLFWVGQVVVMFAMMQAFLAV